MLGLLTVFFEDFKGVRECFAFPNFGQYKPHREGFICNAEKEQYECIQEGGNKAILPFKGIRTDSKGYTKKTFRSSERECKNCPLREQCCGKVSKFKKIDESIHKPLYDKMHQKLTENKAYHRRLVKRRSSTVEPVLGTLINHHNMRRINARGMAQANKHVLMAALCYNLKKYLKFSRKLPQIMAKRIAIPQGMLFAIKNDILRPIFSRNTPSNFLDFFLSQQKYGRLKRL
jgi:hypothetical protein